MITYLSLGGTILCLLITVGGLFYKILKTVKKCRQTCMVAGAILPFIREAEKLEHYTGIEKKTYVMTRAAQYALERKIIFNEKLVSERIEEVISLTKQVNSTPEQKKKTWL